MNVFTPLHQARLQHSLVRAINYLNTSPQLVIGSNATRTGITFHNPGTQAVVVFPRLVLIYGTDPRNALPTAHGDIQGQGHNHHLVPSLAQLGGGFYLNPAATLFFTGPTAQQAWQALVINGECQPLTVMEQTPV